MSKKKSVRAIPEATGDDDYNDNHNNNDDDVEDATTKKKRSPRVIVRARSQSNATRSTVSSSLSPQDLENRRKFSPGRVKPRRNKSEQAMMPPAFQLLTLTTTTTRDDDNNQKEPEDHERRHKASRNLGVVENNNNNNNNNNDDDDDGLSAADTREMPSIRRSRSGSSLGKMFRRVATATTAAASSGDKIDKSSRADQQPQTSSTNTAPQRPPTSGNTSEQKSQKQPYLRSKSSKSTKSTLGDLFRRTSSTSNSSSFGTKALQGIHNNKTKTNKLPKNIKEIDGSLWQVDEKGNAIKKVIHKSQVTAGITKSSSNRKIDFAATTTGHSVDSNKMDGRLGRKIRGGRRRVSSDWSVADESATTASSMNRSCISSHKSVDFSHKSIDSRSNSSYRSNETRATAAAAIAVRNNNNNNNRSLSKGALNRLDDSEHTSNSDSSLYLDEIPSKPTRSQSNERNEDAKPVIKKGRPKRRPTTIASTTVPSSSKSGGPSCSPPSDVPNNRRNSTKNNNKNSNKTGGASCLPSSDPNNNNDDDDDPSTAMRMVADLQKQLLESQHEVWRLTQVTQEQRGTVEVTKRMTQKLEADIEGITGERRDLVSELDRLRTKLELREQDLTRKQEELEKERRAAGNLPSSDHLVEKITDLMNENNDLMERMMTRKAEARQQMEKKEGEVRFLQNELDRMRVERGEQDFENLRRASVDNGNNNNGNSTSLQLVDKIWNQKKDASEQVYKRQIQDLKERVKSLELSNGKLKKELENSTLEIKDEDDEETRKAKEVAQAVSKAGLTRTKSAQRVRDRCERQITRSRSPHTNRENRMVSLIKRSQSVETALRRRLNRTRNDDDDGNSNTNNNKVNDDVAEKYEFCNKNANW